MTRRTHRNAEVRAVRKLARLGTPMEPLEGRTLMSAAALAVPTAVTATAAGPTTIDLSWTQSTGSTGYTLLRSVNGGGFVVESHVSGASNTRFADTTVVPNKTYAYKVEAVAPKKTTAPSPPASAKTPLIAPGNVIATLGQGEKVTINWTGNDTTATGYSVFRSTNGGAFASIASVTGKTITTTTDSAIADGASYRYEVEATTSSNTSAVTAPVTVAIPLNAPSATSASASSGSLVHVTWTDNDPAATGYIVLRSTNGTTFTALTTLTGGTAASFTDRTVVPFTTYYYEIEAKTSAVTSVASSIGSTRTPLAVPGAVALVSATASSVSIKWTDSDAAAQGYFILRATGTGSFSQIGQVNSGKTVTFTDSTTHSDTSYCYEIESYNGSILSAASSALTFATPLATPTGLVATAVSPTSVTLTWTDNDPTATGYTILRSTDGVNYSSIATLTSGTATSYVDGTATTGQKYYYQVQATAGSASSAVSAAANATVVAVASTSTVAITTRYTDELVITSTGKDDTISITESGATLSITTDGTTTTDPAPAAGVFVYTRGGADGINIDHSVTSPLTIETIDGAVDDITSAGSDVTAWIDSTDIYTGTGTVHAVSGFMGGTAKTIGSGLADPKDAGQTQKLNASLFGTGPVPGDVNQGGVGDCYFLSTLAAFAGTNPTVIEQSAVDMGDGTYTVQFYNSRNQPVFVRVSNDISTGNYWGYEYARPGTTGDIWALVMEKAYAEFRTGANTYASISSGWMGDVYSALGQNNSYFVPSNYSESQLYTLLSNELANGKAVTLGTDNAPDLVSGHAYTLVSCSIDSSGHTTYVVRNPWGVSGDSLENSQGYATLTYAQLTANFIDGDEAT